MNEDQEDAPRPGDELRQEVVREIVAVAVSVGIQLAVVLAIAKRDELTRLGMRLQGAFRRQRAREYADTQVAILRHEISAWEHAEREG